jgi:hypothetical protein
MGVRVVYEVYCDECGLTRILKSNETQIDIREEGWEVSYESVGNDQFVEKEKCPSCSEKPSSWPMIRP